LTHCSRRSLALRERLTLFARVCDAVAYAHQHLVVHRDLKPSNILVTAEGEPKLLDFGLAKLIKPWSDSGAGAATVTSLRWMTPEYASPEQVRGEAVTTATDVYSLGVVLYELLTGRKPYLPKSSASADLERAILDQEPSRPSAVTTKGASERRALRGDLDEVCAKCLQKDPQRRYGGAAELGDDLRRYLGGRPITARPDSAPYRLRKFAGRHRWGLAASVVASVLLVALVGAYTVRLRQERDRARRETEKQRAVATFLGEVFRAANPILAAGRTVTARELLEEGARRAREIGGDPEVRAELLQEMAEASFRLELHDQALALAREALTLRDRAPGGDRRDLASSLLLVGRVLNRMKRFAEAAPHLERALELHESLGEERQLAQSLVLLASNRASLGRSDEFLPLLERAMEIERAARPTGTLLGELYNRRANYRVTHGDPAGARADYEQAIAVYRRSDEPESWAIAMPLLNLGELLTALGENAGAESLLVQAAEVDARIFGEDSVPSAYTLARLANVALARHDLPLARQRIDRALGIYRTQRPADHPDLAYPYAIDGLVDIAEGRAAEALAALHRAMEIAQRTGEDAEPLFVEIRREEARLQGSGSP
jgi:serine/threonine-protein kinase